jgi:hypothetical protein
MVLKRLNKTIKVIGDPQSRTVAVPLYPCQTAKPDQ